MKGLYLYSSPPWRGIKGVGCIIRHRRELMQGCICIHPLLGGELKGWVVFIV